MPLRTIGEDSFIREMREDDLAAVAEIQSASPSAAHWPPRDYLDYPSLVAVHRKQIRGFLVWRDLPGQEAEILNLAVSLEARRLGLARSLLERMVTKHPGEVFLEVRESNQGAIDFYLSFGFQEVGRRKEYYKNPNEAAIVMRFHSC